MGNDFSTGTHLITTATLFGAAALAFIMFPFLVIMIRGGFKAKENTSSGLSILGVVALAFVVHTLFCLMFISIIKILDITYLDEANFYSQKIFGIFWAEGQGAVLNLVGGGSTSDALGAYATLHLVQAIGKNLLYNIPIVVVVVGLAYGALQANKDTYRTDYLSVLVFSMVSFICVAIIYVTWAYIASEALFLPNKQNLFDLIKAYWEKMLVK